MGIERGSEVRIDEAERTRILNVHPPGWTNPKPAERYDLVAVGGGTAGLVASIAAARLGGRAALIERRWLGGDCLNAGCVPSKAILRSARLAADLRDAAGFGLRVADGFAPDFPLVMERMRRLRARISHHDSIDRLRCEKVDVFLGEARFTGTDRLEVGGETLRFRRCVIAAGSRPHVPAIEGLAEAGFLTNETVFDLNERPRSLLVIGGGPLGCELAQAFCRLGSEVTIVQKEPQFLPKEERDAAQILAEALTRDGVRIRLNTTVVKISGSGPRAAHVESAGERSTVAFDTILLGAGRSPNVEGLGLERAEVEFDPERGVHVDDFLRTTNPRIYAAGDVALEDRYTHMADASARIVVRNSLFLGRRRLSRLVVPWCTYTDPEIAHIGLYVREAREKGIPVRTFTISMHEVDRAILDGEQEGFVKIHVARRRDRILGATVVARHAGEMINEISLAMVAGVGMKTIGRVIHSYPTQAEAIRMAADAAMRTRLTPRIARLARWWLAWRR